MFLHKKGEIMKIERAIILAAGQGTRLQPLTNKIAKPLLRIHNKPIIEYVIETLLKKNIKDITIVTGYRSSQFRYLKKKYNVRLRINKDYDKGSNLLSLKLAIDKIYDCIILDGDILINEHAIKNDVPCSGYSFTYEKCANEWAMYIDDGKIIKIIPDLSQKTNFNALRSISYWVGPQAGQLRYRLMHAADDVNYADDIMIQIPHLRAYEMRKTDFIEIDTLEDYENAKRSME